MSRASSEVDRVLPVDAVRGIAMFFIGVSHISFYLINDSALLATHARALGFIATPNFLLMSGLACGYQLAHAPTAATAMRSVDRGLFALLVGHLLVTASLVYMVPAGTAFEHIVITDSIGVLLCMAPLLRHAGTSRLLWMGGGVYVLSCLPALAWHPVTDTGILLAAVLLALNEGAMPDIGWTSPTLPYLGIFLVGVGLGKLIYECRREGRSAVLDRRLALAGCAAIAVALAANVARHFVKPSLMTHFTPWSWADIVLTTLNIRHDAPPSLTYGLFYGGIGVALLGLLGMLLTRDQGGAAARAVRVAAVVGQASFVSYVAQQWLIDFVPVWVGFDSWLTPATCPLYLVLTTLIMFWLARAWGRWRANRYMTLGLRPGPQWAQSHLPLFAAVVLLIVFLNVLALQNAPRLIPGKLALIPPNPYPWAPAKVAGHQ